MEAVLRDHYGAKGNNLKQRILRKHGYPPDLQEAGRSPLGTVGGVSENALHRLRELANAILHLDREKDEGLSGMDDVQLEKEIVAHLFVLRALIEGVK